MMVILEKDTPLATITLNRPERHNSLIPDLLQELLEAYAVVEADPDLRAVVLEANGRSFSTGGDVRGFYQERANLEAYAWEVVGLLNQVILRMTALRVPIVTAVHGIVTGGSLGFLLASDTVLIAPQANITPWYSIVGFSPDGGWTAMLPMLIGRRRTAEILMQNQTISAETAVAWGLASRIVPAKRIRAEARQAAEEVATKSSGSVGAVKVLLNDQFNQLAVDLEKERAHFVRQIQTAEALEGIANFLGVAD